MLRRAISVTATAVPTNVGTLYVAPFMAAIHAITMLYAVTIMSHSIHLLSDSKCGGCLSTRIQL